MDEQEELELKVEKHFKLLFKFLLIGFFIIIPLTLASNLGYDLGGFMFVAIVYYIVSIILIDDLVNKRKNKKVVNNTNEIKVA